MNEANPRLKSQTGGIAFSACTVANIFVSLIFVLIIRAAHIDENSDLYKYISYLAAPVAISLGCLGTMKYAKNTVREVAVFKCNPVYYVIALLMAFGLIFCVSKINSVTLEFFKLLGYTPRTDSSYVPSLDGWLILPALIFIAVIPAIIEEFLFRGVILSNARAEMGDICTVFTVGFCFSLFHASPEQTVYQFICGCAFALLVIRSGSLLPAVFIHFINNAFILILYACGYAETPFPFAADVALTVLGGAAFAVSVLWLAFLKKPFLKGKNNGVGEFYLFASLGILLNLIMWIISFVAV